MREGRLSLFRIEKCIRGAALGAALCALFGITHLGVGAENPASHGNTESRQTRTASEKNLRPQTPSTEKARLVETFGKLPLRFEANRGQTDSRVKFLSRGSGYTLFLTGDEAVLRLVKSKSNVESQKSKVKNGNPGDRTPNPETLTPSVVRLKLVGANRAAEVTGLDELPTKSNYFIGKDPQKWRTNVPNYGKVQYKDVYPGVDLVYYGNQQQLEYDWVVAPGADPRAITFALDGAEKLSIDRTGDLVISTGGGEVRFRKPVVYQPFSVNPKSQIQNHKSVDGRYILIAKNQITFEIAQYDRSLPLIIDPLLNFSTYLGGSGSDGALGIAVHTSGGVVDAVYVSGGTTSTDFPPAGTPAQPTFGGAPVSCSDAPFFCGDAFVSKINADGTALLYTTYLGGSHREQAFGIAVDSSGSAYVTGDTRSSDFPLSLGAFQTSLNGGRDAFVAKLAPDGSALVYSTYLGGSGSGGDQGVGIVVDSSGDAIVSGDTSSTDFPTTLGAFQTTFGGGRDVFVAKIRPDPTGTAPDATDLIYSTFLGGSARDSGFFLATDASGDAYVTGSTESTDFPTVNAFQASFGGGGTACSVNLDAFCGDAFVAKIRTDPTGATPDPTDLLYSTFLGGSGEDFGFGIAADSSGNAYVTGGTDSADFFTTSGVVQPTFGGGSAGCTSTGVACGDAFVTKIDTNLAGASSRVYSTYLGGSGDEIGFIPAVDAAGNVHVAGETMSADFPITPGTATQPAFGGGTSPPCTIGFCGDAFVTKLNDTGTVLMFSTYLGGSGDEFASLTLDSLGNVYLTGSTTSSDFLTSSVPVSAPLDSTCGTDGTCNSGLSDAFIAKLTDLVLPVATVTPSSLDFGFVGVGSSSSPLTVTLKNDGGSVLGVTSPIAVIGDASNPDSSDFVISGGSCSTAAFVLSPGLSCTIDVTFTPTQSNARRALLEIIDNADGSPHRVSLAGNGPVLFLSPSSMFFFNQPLNITSPTQVATLFNNGSATVTITSIVTSGDFTQSNNCNGSLAPGTFCSIDISFLPTATGLSVSTLTVTDNASNTPETINLQGQGIAMQLSRSFLSFSPQLVGTTSPAQTVILVNASSSPVTSLNIVASGNFAQSNNCGTSRAAKSGCTISVTFTPTATGFRSGSITITHSSPESPQVISLSGTGITAPAPPPPAPTVTFSPSFVSFGSQTLNTTSAATPVTMTNNTTGALTINSIVPSGDFARTTNCGTTLAAGASCTINVTFTPTAVGGRSGNITVTHSGLDSPSTLGLFGQGVVLVVSPTFLSFQSGVGITSASQSVTLTNTGATTVSITSIITSGPVFAQTNTCGTSLAGHASCNIDVTYTPVAPNTIEGGAVQITSTAPDSPKTVFVVGVATTVLLSPFALSFGPQALFLASSAKSITMTNQTGGTLAISSIVASGDFAAPDNNCGTSLLVDANCSISVTFTPTAIGVRTGTLTVTDGAVDSPHTATLQGTGAVMMLNPPTLNFASQGLGTTSTAQVATLTNTSDVTVDFTSPIAVTSGTFSQTNDCGTSLVSGGTCFITVKFTPDEVGQEFGTVTITDDAEDSPQALRLSGNGTTLVFSPSSLFFSSQNVGTPPSAPQTVTVTNGTAGTIKLYGISKLDVGAGLDFALINNCGASLAASANCTFNVTFSPTAAGSRFESLSFVDDAPDSPQPMFVFGTGVDTTPPNPVPVINPPLVPASKLEGGAAFTLTVNGTNFVAGATVNWDGFALATTFISSSQLMASVPATNIAAAGTASVTVVNPTPGGGTSNVVFFQITSPPTLVTSPTALTMPDTPINLTCVPRTVTLTNTSAEPVTFSSIATSSAEFTQTNNCGTSLAATANCTVSVVFHPTTTGVRAGTLTITSDAVGSPHQVSLTGTGQTACPLSALVRAERVLRGADSATFTVFQDTGCEAKDQITLACQNEAPAQCDFNPGTIRNPDRSQMTIRNLQAVGGSIKQFQVTGTSGDLQRTLYLQVLFADFSFTKYPNEASVKAGETASYAISIVPVNGLAGRMALKCTGVPVGTSCTVTPGEVTLEGAPVQVAVKVRTTQRGVVPDLRPRGPSPDGFPAPGSRLPILLWSVLAMLMAAVAAVYDRQRSGGHGTGILAATLLLVVLTWASCGGGGGVGPAGWQGGTPLGTHTLVIQGTLTTPGAGVATDSNTPPLTHETQITLKVN